MNPALADFLSLRGLSVGLKRDPPPPPPPPPMLLLFFGFLGDLITRIVLPLDPNSDEVPAPGAGRRCGESGPGEFLRALV